VKGKGYRENPSPGEGGGEGIEAFFLFTATRGGIKRRLYEGHLISSEKRKIEWGREGKGRAARDHQRKEGEHLSREREGWVIQKFPSSFSCKKEKQNTTFTGSKKKKEVSQRLSRRKKKDAVHVN